MASQRLLQLLGSAVGSQTPVPPLLLKRLLPQLSGTLSLSSSSAALFPDVVVPPLGESVKDGTIAALLKQVGQAVKVDEVVAQIETDKVTIDIKSPVSGVLQALNVKPGDTVVPGTVLATVGEGAQAAAPSPSLKTTNTQASAPNAPSPVAASVSTDGAHRKHMISFPPRRSPEGLRLSDLPAASHPGSSPTSQAAHGVPAYSPEAKAPPPPPRPFTIGNPRLARGGPPRREMTQREIDIVNLGGAV